MMDFPLLTREPEALFKNENAFCEYLLTDPALWQRLGVFTPHAYRTHTSPDFLAYCRSPASRRTTRKAAASPILGIEVEMRPANFRRHGHDPFNIGLVVSLACWWPSRKVRGVDIVSFYRGEMGGWYRWSLDDDIDVLYHGRPSRLYGKMFVGEQEDIP